MSRTNLPLEIIEEAILPLLPAKSLCSFKLVSKAWNSLISDPQFIKTHTRRLHQNIPKLIALSPTTRSLYSIDIIETLDRADIPPATVRELTQIRCREILGSCNGLVLAKDGNENIFVMNPTSVRADEVLIVPPSPFTPPPPLDEYDDDEEEEEVYVSYGFGYDSSTDDYKIVALSFWDLEGLSNYKAMCATVYSLRNKSWRKLPFYCYNEHDLPVSGVLINGALINQSLHWISRELEIVGFNLANEEFSQMKLPSSSSAKGRHTSLFCDVFDIGGKIGVFRGSSSLFMNGEMDFECCVMEEYGVSESWGKLFDIDGVDSRSVKPVCMIGQEIVFEEDEGRSGVDAAVVVAYNVDERRSRDVRIPGGPLCLFAGTYVETLESPKRMMIITPP